MTSLGLAWEMIGVNEFHGKSWLKSAIILFAAPIAIELILEKLELIILTISQYRISIHVESIQKNGKIVLILNS